MSGLSLLPSAVQCGPRGPGGQVPPWCVADATPSRPAAAPASWVMWSHLTTPSAGVGTPILNTSDQTDGHVAAGPGPRDAGGGDAGSGAAALGSGPPPPLSMAHHWEAKHRPAQIQPGPRDPPLIRDRNTLRQRHEVPVSAGGLLSRDDQRHRDPRVGLGPAGRRDRVVHAHGGPLDARLKPPPRHGPSTGGSAENPGRYAAGRATAFRVAPGEERAARKAIMLPRSASQSGPRRPDGYQSLAAPAGQHPSADRPDLFDEGAQEASNAGYLRAGGRGAGHGPGQGRARTRARGVRTRTATSGRLPQSTWLRLLTPSSFDLRPEGRRLSSAALGHTLPGGRGAHRSKAPPLFSCEGEASESGRGRRLPS